MRKRRRRVTKDCGSWQIADLGLSKVWFVLEKRAMDSHFTNLLFLTIANAQFVR
ncbi:hypothetical protein KsCSTR_34340 [Candidatus Kuenenia stuttgartiensis]|uniref:Uncharacterized protein n=1 Tax=Kuenenia stuttgartiensis TaxID=174633 RepID=A0A6G7GTY1_KUEST|nr:hypothetical protein KsCSTR_34340 [Candidatus Kuenenia stuttgartiensis]